MPAAKFPTESRATIVLTVFVLVALLFIVGLPETPSALVMLRPVPLTAMVREVRVFDAVRAKKPFVTLSRRDVRLLVVKDIVGLPDTPSALEMANPDPDPTAMLRATILEVPAVVLRTKNPSVPRSCNCFACPDRPNVQLLSAPRVAAVAPPVIPLPVVNVSVRA